MEEAAETLLKDVGLPLEHAINRVSRLPSGFVERLRDDQVEASPFWHIYLDNYASGQRVRGEIERSSGGVLHEKAEGGWNARGVLTAPQKSVHRACVQGEKGWLGAETARLEKTLKLSLWLSCRNNLRRKSLQICLGRWMHILQFRRPCMAHFSGVWEFLKAEVKKKEWQARWELLTIGLGTVIAHTDLTAIPSPLVTASDASQKGGAVGAATGVSWLGRDFLRYEVEESAKGLRVPVLVISLFDGIGGARRSYDLAGVPRALRERGNPCTGQESGRTKMAGRPHL